MPLCSIRQCGSRKNKTWPGLSFHRFPTNEKLKKKWMEAIGVENINPQHKVLWVCSKHFEERNFNRTLDVVRLRDNSVPSLYMVTSNSPSSSVLIENENVQEFSRSLLPSQNITQDVACTEISNLAAPSYSVEKDNGGDLYNMHAGASSQSQNITQDMATDMNDRTETNIVPGPADCETAIAEAAESMHLPESLPPDGRWPVISINGSDPVAVEVKLGVCGDSADDTSDNDANTNRDSIVAHDNIKLELKPPQPEVSSTDIGGDPDSNASINNINIISQKRSDKKGSSKQFSCSDCDYKCSNNNLLVLHMRTHTGEKPFSCDYCELKFSQAAHLKAHVMTHTGDKPYSCKYCDYRCLKHCNLINHERTHTGEKPFSCEHCDYKTSRSYRLKTHMKMHTGEKPEKIYCCEHCEYKTSERSHLKTHTMIHTGEKPFACNQCGYKCTRNKDLKTHMMVHTGEKPIACEHCDYKCSRTTLLKIHMRAHLGLKPYSCHYCDYRCSQNSSLKTHIKIHTGEKPFSCNVCDYKTVSRSCLVTHMKKHT